MSDAETRLAEDRRNRTAARGLFDVRLGQVKQDIGIRSVPARIKSKAQDQAFELLDHGIDVAQQNKGIVAATIGALGLWFLRRPLIRWAREHFGQARVQDDESSVGPEHDEEQTA
jgi:hypothetical protein